jgi:hypothetical protein
MREASSLHAELTFVTRTLTMGVLAEIREVIRGDLYGLARVGAMIAGITLAGLGHLSGRLASAGRAEYPPSGSEVGRAYGESGRNESPSP